jgi:hypothetical protein
MTKINTPELYDRLHNMTEQEREEILDPICDAVRGKVQMPEGGEAMANRIFALAVLDLYRAWQEEIWNRD